MIIALTWVALFTFTLFSFHAAVVVYPGEVPYVVMACVMSALTMTCAVFWETR